MVSHGELYENLDSILVVFIKKFIKNLSVLEFGIDLQCCNTKVHNTGAFIILLLATMKNEDVAESMK